jgi:hypothetical protein
MKGVSMRIRLGVPRDANEDEKEAILNAALESVTLADQAQLARGLPTAAEAIARGVRWKPEPPGDEHFDLAGTVLRRGWGDCDDLAPWHAASLRMSGEDPEAMAFVRRSGPNRWHAVVQRSNGQVDDPSRAAGMGVVGGDEYRGPFWDAMYGNRYGFAMSPLANGFAGRVDVPSLSVPAVYSALARGRTPAGAVRGACVGALQVCGHDTAYEHELKTAALHDLLNGADYDDVEQQLEAAGGVGFLPFLAPAAASIAAPLASKALSMFGGGGGGGGAPAAPGGGGGGGGMPGGGGGRGGGRIYNPTGQGPIIIRF